MFNIDPVLVDDVINITTAVEIGAVQFSVILPSSAIALNPVGVFGTGRCRQDDI